MARTCVAPRMRSVDWNSPWLRRMGRRAERGLKFDDLYTAQTSIRSLLAWGAWIEMCGRRHSRGWPAQSLLAWGEWIEIGSVYERGWISSQFCDNHDFLKNFIAIQVNTHPVMNAFTLSLSHSIFIPIDIRHATMIRIDRIFFMRTSRESDIMLIKQEAWLPARLESLKLIYVCGVCVFGTLFVLTSCF